MVSMTLVSDVPGRAPARALLHGSTMVTPSGSSTSAVKSRHLAQRMRLILSQVFGLKLNSSREMNGLMSAAPMKNAGRMWKERTCSAETTSTTLITNSPLGTEVRFVSANGSSRTATRNQSSSLRTITTTKPTSTTHTVKGASTWQALKKALVLRPWLPLPSLHLLLSHYSTETERRKGWFKRLQTKHFTNLLKSSNKINIFLPY